MSLIDSNYFIGAISLPTDNVHYTNKLQIYIDRTEKEYLVNLMGYELYKLYIAAPTIGRFEPITNGTDFSNTVTGLEDNWQGLVNEETYISMLAYFTYFEYLRGNQSSETGNGVTYNLFENSEKISAIHKQQNAFNLAVEQYVKLRDYLTTNSSTFPEWHYVGIEKLSIMGI